MGLTIYIVEKIDGGEHEIVIATTSFGDVAREVDLLASRVPTMTTDASFGQVVVTRCVDGKPVERVTRSVDWEFVGDPLHWRALLGRPVVEKFFDENGWKVVSDPHVRRTSEMRELLS